MGGFNQCASLTILEKLIFIKNSFGAYHYLSTTNASSHLTFYVWLPSKNGMLEMKLLKSPLVRRVRRGFICLAVASARESCTLTSELSTVQTCGTEFK